MADLFATAPETAPIEGESRGWVPATYLDEISPPCRPTPSDWLVVGDVLRLAPPDEDAGYPGRVVREGEIVSFYELTEFPAVRAVWNGPSQYVLLSPVPEERRHFS